MKNNKLKKIALDQTSRANKVSLIFTSGTNYFFEENSTGQQDLQARENQGKVQAHTFPAPFWYILSHALG